MINKFNSKLRPIIQTYQHYISAFEGFASFVYSDDLLFTTRVMSVSVENDVATILRFGDDSAVFIRELAV